MGNLIRAQKKGKSRRYRSPERRFKFFSEYRECSGEIIDIVRTIGRPLVKIKSDKGEFFMIAPEDVKVGDRIEIGGKAGTKTGNVLPLEKIPEGTPIFNIEGIPGDNGSFVKSGGGFGIIISKDKECVVRFPSKKTRSFDPRCRATLGSVAGGGRLDKPVVKAGIKHKIMKAKGKLYPTVSGCAMNPVDHPFGGKTKPGIPKSVSRNRPPGSKVGSIASRRTGRKR